MEHEHHHGRIDRSAQVAAPRVVPRSQVDVREAPTRPRPPEHFRRPVDADHPRDVGPARNHAACAAPEVGHVQVTAAGRGAPAGELAEELLAQSIHASPSREDCLTSHCAGRAPGRAAGILSTPARPTRCSRVRFPQRARAPSGPSSDNCVVTAGAVAARCHPAGIRQHLQVAARRRLRQLEHGAQLAHCQLVSRAARACDSASGRPGPRTSR